MAAFLFQHAARQLNHPVAVLSMGTLNITGRSAHPHAVQVLADWDIDLSSHRSQGVSLGILGHADVIVAMAEKHRLQLCHAAPHLRPRIQLMSEYDPDRVAPADIADPIDGTLQDFIECRDRLWRCIRQWTGVAHR
ncbi:MAG: hypothetical protein KGO50_17150 [Myxococcales bacterium]|nr:hypothetical protein [Myxococcales bacterium]